MSAAEGQAVTELTVIVLESLRSEEIVDIFFARVRAAPTAHYVAEPCLPRRRKVSRSLDDSSFQAAFQTSLNYFFEPIFYEALDLITICVKERFEQPGYNNYLSVQNLILKVAAIEPCEAELQHVLDFYGADLDRFLLPTHLEIYGHSFLKKKDKKVSLSSALEFSKVLPHIFYS